MVVKYYQIKVKREHALKLNHLNKVNINMIENFSI